MWVFLKFNDFNVVVDIDKSQRMRCILCHSVQQKEVDQSSTQSQKGFIMYNKDHGITAMNRHVVSKHLQF